MLISESGEEMHRFTLAACCAVVVGIGPVVLLSQSRNPSAPVLYEGARLIVGDDRPAIDSGAFVVQRGRITAIGQKGQIKAASGATRVDLTGKTVMPALVNAHIHVGYETFSTAAGDAHPENFTAGTILDHLQRQAFYGVGTVHDGGSGHIPTLRQFLVDTAARRHPPAAQYSMMAGVVPIDGGPDHILIKGTRPLGANYEVIRSGEARAAVQDSAAKGIRHVKVWLGDRNGTYPAMPHEVYDAVIDEAHKLGLKVHAHATSLRDQKDALRAGVDVLVHTIQSTRIDDELMALVKEKKPYWTPVMGLGDRSEVCDGDPFVEQVLSDKIVADIRATNCGAPNPNARTREENLKYNFMRMIESGARLVLGTDAGVWPRYSFGQADHHEIRRYVELGLSPAQAIVAATSRPAELLELEEVGTLAEGNAADFLVLDANPLDDIGNTRRIASVYLRGAMLDREALLRKWKQTPPSQ